MKKYIHILMSVLLSMTVLLMGPGFNVVRCMHSGEVRAVTCLDKSNMGCSPTSDQIKPIVRIFDLVRGGPPRDYLSFIRVLRI